MIRLHEIEFGVSNPAASRAFYQLLFGLQPIVEQEGLTVFRSGNEGVDFNISDHLPPATTVISFLTDNLESVLEKLEAMNIKFQRPQNSHLGMRMIEFTDPDGIRVRVNQPTNVSPGWLKA